MLKLNHSFIQNREELLAEKLRSSLEKWCYYITSIIIIYDVLRYQRCVSEIYILPFNSFVAVFKDEYKLPKGSVIELSRESNHVLKICSKFISLCLHFSFVGFSTLVEDLLCGRNYLNSFRDVFMLQLVYKCPTHEYLVTYYICSHSCSYVKSDSLTHCREIML